MKISFRYSITLIILLLISGFALATPIFPTLTGRVVDDAHILTPQTQQQLDSMLADYERGTTNQVVVVTLASLKGYAIEDYGYQLGRHWQIGQQGKNNGVLMIVAANDHKVRIEVGYGLEPVLTDAASNYIIQNIILPDFRAGQLNQGVIDGTKAILNVLGGKSISVAPVSDASQSNSGLPLLWIILFGAYLFYVGGARRARYIPLLMSTSGVRLGGSGTLGGNSGFGGFIGGGGGFGGGGASGSW